MENFLHISIRQQERGASCQLNPQLGLDQARALNQGM